MITKITSKNGQFVFASKPPGRVTARAVKSDRNERHLFLTIKLSKCKAETALEGYTVI